MAETLGDQLRKIQDEIDTCKDKEQHLDPSMPNDVRWDYLTALQKEVTALQEQKALLLKQADTRRSEQSSASSTAADVILSRLPAASKHAAHLPINIEDPSQGKEAATVVAPGMLVTFAHEPHDLWEVGQRVTAMVHNAQDSKRQHTQCTVLGMDKHLDILVLQVDEPDVLLAPPDVDAELYAGQSYFLLGQSTQAQGDESSVSHGKIAATQLDAWLHVRGDIESGVGDSGGGVFALSSGKLIAVCVGAHKPTKRAVFAPISSVLHFVDQVKAR